MEKKNKYIREALPVIFVELLFGALTQLGAVALDKWSAQVLIGGIVGNLVASGYYLSLVVTAWIAAERAKKQDVRGGQNLLRIAYPLRMLLVFGVLLLCCITKKMNVLTLLLPMVTIQPAVFLAGVFQKKETKS